MEVGQTEECLIFDATLDKVSLAPYCIQEKDSFSGTGINYWYKGKHYVFTVERNLHIFDGDKWIFIKGFIH